MADDDSFYTSFTNEAGTNIDSALKFAVDDLAKEHESRRIDEDKREKREAEISDKVCHFFRCDCCRGRGRRSQSGACGTFMSRTIATVCLFLYQLTRYSPLWDPDSLLAVCVSVIVGLPGETAIYDIIKEDHLKAQIGEFWCQIILLSILLVIMLLTIASYAYFAERTTDDAVRTFNATAFILLFAQLITFYALYQNREHIGNSLGAVTSLFALIYAVLLLPAALQVLKAYYNPYAGTLWITLSLIVIELLVTLNFDEAVTATSRHKAYFMFFVLPNCIALILILLLRTVCSRVFTSDHAETEQAEETERHTLCGLIKQRFVNLCGRTASDGVTLVLQTLSFGKKYDPVPTEEEDNDEIMEDLFA